MPRCVDETLADANISGVDANSERACDGVSIQKHANVVQYTVLTELLRRERCVECRHICSDSGAFTLTGLDDHDSKNLLVRCYIRSNSKVEVDTDRLNDGTFTVVSIGALSDFQHAINVACVEHVDG